MELMISASTLRVVPSDAKGGKIAPSLRPRAIGALHIPPRCPHRRNAVAVRSIGGDAVQGWVDLAKLVSGGGGFKSVYKELAQKIGSDIYIDVNGWHLFLRDVSVGSDLKLNQALAQQIGEESGKGSVDLPAMLKKVPIKVGGGKTTVSLHDAIPSFSFDDLQKIVDDFQRD